MAESTEDDPKDSKKEEQKPPLPKRVVVTYGIKHQDEDNEVPEEILPHPPTSVVQSPVGSDFPPVTGKVGSSSVKSRVRPELPDEILPHHSRSAAPPPPPPPDRNAPEPSQEPPSPRQTSSGLALFLSLLTSVAVIALMFFAYFSQQQLADIQVQTTEDKTAVSTLMADAKASLGQFQTIAQENAKEKAVLQQLQQELERSQARFVMLRGNRDWVLSEVNYLVFMANERLQAAKDIPTAVAQLKVAEERLLSLADPSLQPVKMVLSQDIAKLMNTPQVDRQALWSQVEALSPLIAKLKFKVLGERPDDDAVPADTTSLTWREGLAKSWQELKSLVKITRIEENPIPAAFTQQEQAQILRTLQLLNQQAQWGVLQGDSKVYLDSLKTLQSYIKSYSVENPNQAQLLSHIQQLEQQRVEMPLPDISQSLQALSSIPLSKKE